MKKILILGAGLSSTTLIKYLLEHAEKNDWRIRLGDISIDLAREKINNHPKGMAIFFNVDNSDQLVSEISKADLVVSMLPAKYHFSVARECIRYEKNMVTASYVCNASYKSSKRRRCKTNRF